MPTFEMVCLANSRKWQGRCVAGLRTDGEGWLRPVGSNAQGVLHSYHYTLPNNTEAQPLDILRIDCSRPHPKPHHPEDWVAMPVLWRLVSRSCDGERLDWLRGQLTSGSDLLGCRSDRIAHTALQARPASHSLALVAPQNLEWIIKAGNDGKRSVRAKFALNGAEYNLSLTDPVCEGRLQGLPFGTHPRQAARIKEDDEIWLTISLGEPFAPSEESEEFCYKLVAAVITVPRVGSTVPPGKRAQSPVGSRVAEGKTPDAHPAPDLSHYPDPFADAEIAQAADGGMNAPPAAPAILMPAASIALSPDAPALPLCAAPSDAPVLAPPPVPDETEESAPSVRTKKAASREKEAALVEVTPAAASEMFDVPASLASETASRPAASKSSWREKIAKMRQTVPRAYMPWSREEDVVLRQLITSGETVEAVSAQMQRHSGSIRVRLEKLGLKELETNEAASAGEPTASSRPDALPQAAQGRAKRQAQEEKSQAQYTETAASQNQKEQAAGSGGQQSAIADIGNVASQETVIRPLAQTQGAPKQSAAGEQNVTADNLIRVAVCGAAGRMGREVVRAIVEADGLHLVAAVDVASFGIDAGELAGVGKVGVVVESQLEPALERWQPDVLVDFTLPDSVKRNAIVALENKVSPVIGTTGLSASDLSTLDALAKEQGIGAFIAPNFAIGAVLAMQFAAQAARYLPDVEIIELHHEKKLDSPSGTALLTAMKIAQARQEAGQMPQPLPANPIEKAPGARGARHANTGDIPVHSVRLPGFVAHQEVIFGGQGEILTIRHDSLNRASFMPGVVLAVRKVRTLSGLVIGLENLLS